VASSVFKNIDGMARVTARLKGLPDKVQLRVMRKATRAGTAVMYRAAKSNARRLRGKGHDAGITRSGRRRVKHIDQYVAIVKANGGRGVERYAVTCTDNKAHIVEYGSKPHIIALNKSKRGRKRGGVMPIGDGKYATRVRHPGSRPRPFMRPAFELADQAIEEIVRIAEQELARLQL